MKTRLQLHTKIQRAIVIFSDQEKYGLVYSDNIVDIVDKLLDKKLKTTQGTQSNDKEVLSHPRFTYINIKKEEMKQIIHPFKFDLTNGQPDFKFFSLK